MQSLHAWTSSQCIGSGVMPPLDPKLLVCRTKNPEAGDYLSNKYEIHISPKINVIPSGEFPNLWTKNNFATTRRSSPNVVNI